MFVVLKGPNRGRPLTAKGLDEIMLGARRRAGLEHATCHELRHTCFTRLREAGMALEALQARRDPSHLAELGQDPLPPRTGSARSTIGAHDVYVEQRLVNALRSVDRVEPSADLWSRVVHSIEEDQAHRRRVVESFASIILTATGLAALGVLNMIDLRSGRQVRLGVMELIETIALVLLVAVLGPAIRRFGHGYAHDLWRTTPDTPTALVRLLDVAYLLVFVGYILLTAHFDFERATIGVAQQLEDLGWRIGGLLLTMGLLHAATIMTLPVVALIANSTRGGRPLPRWLAVVLVIGAGSAGLLAVWSIAGLVIGGIQ